MMMHTLQRYEALQSLFIDGQVYTHIFVSLKHNASKPLYQLVITNFAKKVHEVGFEPTHLTILHLKCSALDHYRYKTSAIRALAYLVAPRFTIYDFLLQTFCIKQIAHEATS